MTSLGENLGTLSLPVNIPTVTTDQGLKSLDPGRAFLASLFRTAIRSEFTAAWTEACKGIDPAEKLSTTDPVADLLELEPTGVLMTQRQAAFPLLAVYRSGRGEYQSHTVYADKLTQPWTVDWILGPASVARTRQLLDAAVAIAKVVARVCFLGGHPDFSGGDVPFAQLRMVSHEGPGQAKFAGDEGGAVYWAITLSLETTEYVTQGEGAELDGIFEGADYELGVGGAPEGVMPGLVYASTTPVFQPQG
jgi:hypothetical protein